MATATIERLQAAIPLDMIDVPRWLCWKLEKRPGTGKATKVPYSPKTGNRASACSSTGWGTYDQAIARVQRARAGAFDGVGFVLGDGWAGVDLDHCRDVQTGELADWAAEIVRRLASYSEVSPSGTGVHIYLRGTLPDGPRKHTGAGRTIELYETDRYFTVTGQQLPGTPATVEERTQELEALHKAIFQPHGKRSETRQQIAHNFTEGLSDAELIEKACSAKGGAGADFTALWNGDAGADESAADYQLCKSLAFWCGDDAERIDSLYRQSGLMRPKWDRKDGPYGTYGARTIHKAMLAQPNHYSPPAPKNSGQNSTEIKFDFPADGHESCHARIAELEAENASLRASLSRMNAHELERKDIRAAKMDPRTKLVTMDVLDHLDRETSDFTEYSLEQAAQRLDMTSATVSNHLKKAVTAGVVEKTVQPTGRDLEKVTVIRPGRVILEQRRLREVETEASQAGGKRDGAGRKPARPGLCSCGSHNVIQRHITKKTVRRTVEVTTIEQVCHDCASIEIVDGGEQEISSELLDVQESEIKFDFPQCEVPNAANLITDTDGSAPPVQVNIPAMPAAPARACFRCRQEAWVWNEAELHWQCGACQPVSYSLSQVTVDTVMSS